MSVQVMLLKRKARQSYETYYKELGRYECGKSVGEAINPRMLEAKIEFNETMDKLADLDPECPKVRL